MRTQVDRLQGKLGEDEEEGEQLKEYKQLVALEDKAKEEGVGRWGQVDPARNVTWVVDAAGAFIDTHRGKELPALVEHVFNASMLRLYLPTIQVAIHVISNLIAFLDLLHCFTCRYSSTRFP